MKKNLLNFSRERVKSLVNFLFFKNTVWVSGVFLFLNFPPHFLPPVRIAGSQNLKIILANFNLFNSHWSEVEIKFVI